MDIIRWVLVPLNEFAEEQQQVKYVHLIFDSNDTHRSKSECKDRGCDINLKIF